MKRIKIILSLALVLLLLGAALAFLRPNRAAPKFVPASTASFSYLTVAYREPAAAYAGGKVWAVGIRAGDTVGHTVLYDIDRRAVVGELLNAEPDFLSEDQTRLLCRQSGASFKGRLGALINRLSGNRIELDWPNHVVETVWVLDLRSGGATKLGQHTMWYRYESVCTPAPGFRRALIGVGDGPWYLCDLEKNRLRQIAADGSAQGWWDDHDVLIEGRDHDLALLDVTTGKTSVLFGTNSIAQSLRGFGLTNDPTSLALFSNWNGRDYDFYLMAGPADQLGNPEPFLLKADHTGPSLRLLYRNFPEHLSSVLDASATHLLYVRIQSPNNPTEGIILRDLREGSEVAIDQAVIGSYFAPQFYRDGVLFYKGDNLWYSDLDGSNHIRLLPPPDK